MQCDGRFLFVCRLIVYCALFEKRTNHFHIIKFTWASKRVHWFQYWHVRSIYKHLYCFQLSQSHCHRKRGKTNYLRMKPLYSAYTKREKNAPNINPNVLENRSEHRFYLFWSHLISLIHLLDELVSVISASVYEYIIIDIQVTHISAFIQLR